MLRVTSAAGDRSFDVVATVEPSHTVEELRRALVAQTDVGDGPVLARRASGQALDASSTLAEIGLVSGEELTLTSSGAVAASSPDEPTLIVEAVGGPAAGWRVELRPGRYMLGRPLGQGGPDPAYLALPDSAVSRAHIALDVRSDLSVTVTENPDATNPLLIDGVHPDGPVTVDNSTEIRLGDSVLICRTVDPSAPARIDQLGQVAFHRTPLRPARPEEVKVTPLTKVPTEPEPARFSWLGAAAPVLGGVLMAIVLGEPRFLFFTLLAPLTGAAGFFEGRKRNRERHKRDMEAFEKRFAKREEEWSEAYEAEEATRFAAAPDIADLRRRAERRDHTLWSRNRHIDEFLRLRVGIGPAEPNIEADYASEGEEDLISRLEEQEERYEKFPRVPITVPLADLGILGIHGPHREVAALGKALLVQAVCLHSPEDLVVVGAASSELDLVSWLRWVPHTHSTGSPIGGVHLAADKEGADQLLRDLLEVAEFRTVNQGRDEDRRWPWILVVLDRMVEPDAHLLAQVLDRSPEAGISVIWLSDTVDRVPPQCKAVAELVDRTEGGTERLSKLWFTDPETDNEEFSADGVDRSLPDTVARALAPLRDASSATATASIPRVVPLFGALGIDEATPGWIQQEWAVDRKGDAPYAVEAVVGTTADGPLKLDLVADGPHGLIGGTSGAGKSELIAALVAGLVAYQSPKDLSLMFIDFKGGSASEPFKDLPHISGRVTDLDESLALRAQVSLRAELRRRVALFSSLSANDMAEMRRLHPDEAPPSLVIVIDEFATLVKQLPEFVADIIDIAQRGRSYGVYLLLATQRPSASVDDNILANTNLRISLRMLDRVESMSILNAPDAADIPVPLKGRSIARMGPGQLVEFQSAYCSAPVATTKGRPPVLIEPLGVQAPGAGGSATIAGGEDEVDPRTQLDELIDAVIAVGAPKVRQIWNDLLPEHFAFTEADKMRRVPGYAKDPGRLVLIGGADDPANQTQHASVADLESGGGLLVLGTAGSGKSTALRTIAASAALDDKRAGGGTVLLYVLDFSSGELRSLEALPQCDGVGTLDDMETTTRIISTLSNEVIRRRQDHDGESTDHGPNIILMVDGYSNLIEALQNTSEGQEQATDQWLNAFHRIVLDGRQLGVHSVLTADRAASIRNSIFASITKRLVLRQVDPAETSTMGVPPTTTFGPGAGYLDGLQVQVATIAAPGQDEREATEAFAEIIDVTPPDLVRPPLPEFVARPDLQTAGTGSWTGMVGIADISADEVPFDFNSLDLLVTGPPQSGKSWALRSIAEQLEANGKMVYAIGAEDSGLRKFTWKAAAWGPEEIDGLIGTMKAELEYPGRDAVLVIDDLDLVENPNFDNAAMGLGHNRSIRVLGSTTGFGYSNNELVKRVRAARQVLYLQPGSSREVAEVIGVMRLPLLRLGLELPPGRGMFVRNRVPIVTQVYAPTDTSPSS